MRVAEAAGVPLAAVEERRFEGGEFKLRPLESVRGRTVLVLQSLAPSLEFPAPDRLVRLLFLLYGLRDAGARSTMALIPYLSYARKDRRTQPRDPVNTRYVAQLLESTAVDRIVALDVHSPTALDNAFRVPVDHLTALPMMAEHFARRSANTGLTVVSPDVGGIKRAQIFRELLQRHAAAEVELAFIEKRRARDVVETGALVGYSAGRSVIVIDDLCATGGTLVRAAEICSRAGASTVHVAFTHGPHPAGIESLLTQPSITSVTATDSVALPPGASGAHSPKLTTLSIATLLGQAIRRILAGEALTPLLERWPIEG
jgi:ribose-phosphate pyrophosphokinase